MTYEDKEIDAKHGDLFSDKHLKRYSKYSVTTRFHFRAGPVSLQFYYRSGQRKKAYGGPRRFKYIQRLREDEAARLDGFKVRNGRDNKSHFRLMYWGEYPYQHNEKCWKRHRKTQYK